MADKKPTGRKAREKTPYEKDPAVYFPGGDIPVTRPGPKIVKPPKSTSGPPQYPGVPDPNNPSVGGKVPPGDPDPTKGANPKGTTTSGGGKDTDPSVITIDPTPPALKPLQALLAELLGNMLTGGQPASGPSVVPQQQYSGSGIPNIFNQLYEGPQAQSMIGPVQNPVTPLFGQLLPALLAAYVFGSQNLPGAGTGGNGAAGTPGNGPSGGGAGSGALGGTQGTGAGSTGHTGQPTGFAGGNLPHGGGPGAGFGTATGGGATGGSSTGGAFLDTTGDANPPAQLAKIRPNDVFAGDKVKSTGPGGTMPTADFVKAQWDSYYGPNQVQGTGTQKYMQAFDMAADAGYVTKDLDGLKAWLGLNSMRGTAPPDQLATFSYFMQQAGGPAINPLQYVPIALDENGQDINPIGPVKSQEQIRANAIAQFAKVPGAIAGPQGEYPVNGNPANLVAQSQNLASELVTALTNPTAPPTSPSPQLDAGQMLQSLVGSMTTPNIVSGSRIANSFTPSYQNTPSPMNRSAISKLEAF